MEALLEFVSGTTGPQNVFPSLENSFGTSHQNPPKEYHGRIYP